MRIPNRYREAVINKEINFDTLNSWYLHGEPGTGKTYYVWAFYISLVKKISSLPESVIDKDGVERFYASSDPPFRIINWAVQCADFRSISFEKRDSVIYDMINSKMLIIDDVGSEIKTDFSDDILFRILNERYEEMLYTSFTSNHNLGGLHYDGRIISRIGGIVGDNKFKLTGKDRRL